MGKLIFALPLVALLILTGVVLLKDKKNLEKNPITLLQWTDCLNHVSYDQDCLNPNKKPVQATFSLIDYTSDSALPACKSFYTYIANANGKLPLNLNNFYEDCFLNEKTLHAAKIDSKTSCFYSQYFKPKYIECYFQ
ncbi:transmembrane protein, putative (macronuclear) [Tetrahymena thermophila SB210]|uniref:Transmembrane protein, putative n=1 Tax=Tetrahymena thermophila (strain SB210) TaxID=312017 RepID=W7X8M0_TETTS|nr:transmembrane protein, putative [Tetrahymena thermophila SB210]EWS72753.1 transmembrane protein, putative [Tetrahymena thermophila SB210]|eukprot:XP_012654731.1 transmembrane protein, putative [Tetrahymena thermophila SB210]